MVLHSSVTEVKVVLLNVPLFLSGLQDQSLFSNKIKKMIFHCQECFAASVIWEEK